MCSPWRSERQRQKKEMLFCFITAVSSLHLRKFMAELVLWTFENSSRIVTDCADCETVNCLFCSIQSLEHCYKCVSYYLNPQEKYWSRLYLSVTLLEAQFIQGFQDLLSFFKCVANNVSSILRHIFPRKYKHACSFKWQ